MRLMTADELEAKIAAENIPQRRADELRRKRADLEKREPVGYARAAAQIPAQLFRDAAGLGDLVATGVSKLPSGGPFGGLAPLAALVAGKMEPALAARQERFGYRQPQGGPAALQRIGAAAVESIPFGLSGGLRSMAAEAGIGAGSQAAQEAVGTVTDNPYAKMAAGLLASLAPSGVRAGMRSFRARRPGGVVHERRALEAARGQFDEMIPDSMKDEAARRLAAEVDPATETARLGGRMGRGMMGPPTPGTRAMPVQSLQDIAPAVVSRARSAQKYSPAVQNQAFELRHRNLMSLRAQWDRQFAGGAPEDLLAQYSKARRALADDVRSAFSGVDPRSVRGLPMARVVRARDAAIMEAGQAGEDLLPKRSLAAIERILQSGAKDATVPRGMAGDTTTLAELWSLRKTIDQELSDAFAPLAAPQREKGRYLMQLKSAVDHTMREAARSGGYQGEQILALRSAISTAKKNNVLFAQTHMNKPNPVARAFADNSDAPGPLVDAIMKSKNPRRELRRLALAIGDDRPAREGLKTLITENVFGNKFSQFINPDLDTLAEHGKGIIDTPLRNLRDPAKRAAFEWAHGGGSARNAELFLERVARIQSTDIGTYGAAYRTGTGNLTQKELTERAGVIADVAQRNFLGAARKAIIAGLGKTEVSEAEVEKLVGTALIDPKIGVAFTRPLRPLEWRAWGARWEQVYGRSARSAVGAREQE